MAQSWRLFSKVVAGPRNRCESLAWDGGVGFPPKTDEPLVNHDRVYVDTPGNRIEAGAVVLTCRGHSFRDFLGL